MDAGTYLQDCTTFSTSIVLRPDRYTGTAQLVSGAGQARTTALTLAPFTLIGGDVLRVPIDCPSDSFF